MKKQQIREINKTLPNGHKMILDQFLNGGARELSYNHDISQLEIEALDGRILQPMSTDFYKKFNQDQLSLFCHIYGFYGLPTLELISTVHFLIDGRTAIEIGSGNGCLGRALGIHRTDNKMQEWPEIKKKYKEGNCPTIFYPNDVKKIDYKKAILKYKPQVVVASWVTQNDKNVFGCDEEWILDNCETYIHYGHTAVHGEKKILKYSHDSIYNKFMYSRSARQNPVLQIWNGRKELK